MPLYYYFLRSVSPVEMLMHRIVWSFLFLSSLILLFRGVQSIRCKPTDLWKSLLPGTFLAINWIVFIYASVNGFALQASLGYFLAPLLSVGLGALLLKERFDKFKSIALLLGLFVSAIQCLAHESLPIYGLLLALSFSLLALVRKVWPTHDAITTTWRETVVMLPVAVVSLVFVLSHRQPAFFGSSSYLTPGLLILAGPLTVVPLSLYAFGMPKIDLSDSAILQYLTPTVTFLLAVFYFRESVSQLKLIGFALIWAGLLIYTFSLLVALRPRKDISAPSTEQIFDKA